MVNIDIVKIKMMNAKYASMRATSWVICITVIQKIALSLTISLSSYIFLCTMYLKRPDLNCVDEEDSIEYVDGDDNEGEDLISVFGEGVFQVAVKCRELSGIGHSLQSSFIL